MMAPTLTTERLTLRPYQRGDFEAYAAFMASPRAQYMDGPMDRAQAWGWFCNDVASWALHGYGCLTAEHQDTVVGWVGPTFSDQFREPEIGWLLRDGFEGQGFASEAAQALLTHTFSTTDLTTLVSYIDPLNAASIKVAERLGATVDPAADRPHGDDCLVYRHMKEAA